ncbi:MAG: CvpA family protein [Ruminococcaceae bacterium]|nr:CvpA family protein [Oscillospiraceae bacterium]
MSILSIVLDVIALIIIAMCAISALKNGFMNKIIKKMAPLLSLIVAATGAKTVGPLFNKAAANMIKDNEMLQGVVKYALAFVILFVLSMIVLYIIAWIFKLINGFVNKIPVLGVINKIVCVILGAFVGYFNVTLFIYLLNIAGLAVSSISTAVADTILIKFVENHSLLELVAKKLAELFI